MAPYVLVFLNQQSDVYTAIIIMIIISSIEFSPIPGFSDLMAAIFFYGTSLETVARIFIRIILSVFSH